MIDEAEHHDTLKVLCPHKTVLCEQDEKYWRKQMNKRCIFSSADHIGLNEAGTGY
jgi:hypothetical protein